MKIKNLMFGMIFAMFLLAVTVNATINDPEIGDLGVANLTTGTSKTVQVTVTASGSTATVQQLYLTPEGISTDPVDGQYSNFEAGVGGTTKNFVISASTSGLKELKAYAQEQEATTVQSSLVKTITFVDPSVLTITASADPAATYTSTQTGLVLTLSIRNPLSSSVSTSYSLSLSGGLSKTSGDPTSDTITVASLQTSPLTWTLSASSTGTATFNLGDDTGVHSSTITISISDGDGTTTGGGGGGGGGAAAAKVEETAKVGDVEAGAEGTATFEKEDEIAIQSIKVTVIEAVEDLYINIVRQNTKPSAVTEPTDEIFYYLNLLVKNTTSTNIEKATIKFKVNNTWITDNSIDEDKVALNRWSDDKWNKLTTSKLSKDSTYTYYEAESPGLSYFVITGEKKAEVTAEEEEKTITEEIKEKIEEVVEKVKEAIKGKELPVAIIAVIAVIAIVAGIFGIKKRPKKKSPSSRLAELGKR